MRENRTYGSVRGWRRKTPVYSINVERQIKGYKTHKIKSSVNYQNNGLFYTMRIVRDGECDKAIIILRIRI